MPNPPEDPSYGDPEREEGDSKLQDVMPERELILLKVRERGGLKVLSHDNPARNDISFDREAGCGRRRIGGRRLGRI